MWTSWLLSMHSANYTLHNDAVVSSVVCEFYSTTNSQLTYCVVVQKTDSQTIRMPYSNNLCPQPQTAYLN